MAQVHSGTVPQDDFMSNLSRLANDCRARLLSASQNLVEETNKLEAILKAIPMDQLAALHDQLIESKREVLNVIDGFYARLEQTINTQYANGIKEDEIEGRAQEIFERIAEDQKAINEFSKDLNSKERCLEAMQVIKEADFDGEQQAIQNEIRNYQELVKQNQINVFTNWNVLDVINQQLTQNITLQSQVASIPQVPFSLYQDGGNQSRPDRAPAGQGQGQPGELREFEDNVMYQHSPMKLGGVVVQKGSKKQNAYKYEVENESPEKVAQKRETPNRTPNKTEHSRVEDFSAANRSVAYGAEKQISDPRERGERAERPLRATDSEYQRSLRGTEPEYQKPGRGTEPEYQKQSHIESFARNAPVNSQGPVVVTDDWFDSNHDSQLLHFFQDNSKKLHILDLKKAASTGKFRFEERTLEINFKIPIWHRSIITKQGAIYLTGGSGAGLASDKNLSDVYIYDPIDHTLRPKAKMNYARNSHGICLFQDHIYVVGGCIDEEGYTTQCERYQISRYYEKSVGEWEKIAPLNKAAYAPCLASFNDTYLYKFGGIMNLQQMNSTIERYNPKSNKWTEISYNIFGTNSADFSLMAYAGCIQINENEIYVFGGSKLDGKSSQTYVCRASEKAHIVQKLELDLPCRGTFWNNTLVFGGKVYTLQTVQLNKSDAFFLSKRRLLCYNGEYWDEVPTDDY